MNNEVTARLVAKVKGWTFDDIQKKVNDEFKAWEEVVRKKRPILKQYIRDYNISWDEMQAWEFIKSKALYTNRNLFISALYNNKPVVTFEGRKQWDSEYADTWNNLLKFDYEELNEDEMAYKKVSHMVDYWIYLAVDEWWDKITETPKKRLISPLCWIPDPYFDIINWFSFHWFELKLTEWELNQYYQNKDLMLTDAELEKVKDNATTEEFLTRLFMWADGTWLGLKWEMLNSPLRTYSVYRHFTKFNGRWYLTEWANDRTLLIRLEEIKAVREEEKKDPTKIPCPVVHSWFIPKEWDPFGLCIGDIWRDNQFTEEQVMNLLINKINEEVFSGITLFDPAYINGNELAKKKVWKRKYIPAKMPINTKIIDNVQTQTSATTDGYNLKNLIDAKSTKEIWFDEQSIWVYARRMTATQSQLLQGNQNVRLNTIFKMYLWWEKRYWDVLWYRSYQKNFKMTSEKNIVLNSWIGQINYTIKGKDLNTVQDLHIRLISVLDKQEKEEANKAAYMASYQPLMQQASDFWKLLLTQKFAEVLWMDKELINSIYKFPSEYEQALLDVELLNNDEDAAEIVDMSENHDIYIQIYQQALDTPAKKRAIAARKRAKMIQFKTMKANTVWMPWMEQQGMEWATPESNQNQLINNFISQENEAAQTPTTLWVNVN